MNLLIKEYPIMVLPTLAKSVGLNKAIVLQQLHYWLENPKAGVFRDGFKWIHNTYEEWHLNFPFWSIDTVKRTIMDLEADGLIISAQFAPSWQDRTKSYRIDYVRFEQLSTSIVAICPDPIVAGCTDVSETTTETTNNTASNEIQFSADLPIEWQIAKGNKVSKLPDNDAAKMMDTAHLLATGIGDNLTAYAIAFTFMKTRGIVIPEHKIKAQRKAVKEMMEMNVLPEHVEKAVKQLLKDGMTVTDLYSVSKTAIALANPAPEPEAVIPSKYKVV